MLFLSLLLAAGQLEHCEMFVAFDSTTEIPVRGESHVHNLLDDQGINLNQQSMHGKPLLHWSRHELHVLILAVPKLGQRPMQTLEKRRRNKRIGKIWFARAKMLLEFAYRVAE